jgi:hypothetical protein
MRDFRAAPRVSVARSFPVAVCSVGDHSLTVVVRCGFLCFGGPDGDAGSQCRSVGFRGPLLPSRGSQRRGTTPLRSWFVAAWVGLAVPKSELPRLVGGMRSRSSAYGLWFSLFSPPALDSPRLIWLGAEPLIGIKCRRFTGIPCESPAGCCYSWSPGAAVESSCCLICNPPALEQLVSVFSRSSP